MVVKKIIGTAKDIFSKKNLDYLASDGVGGIFAYGVATLATVLLKEHNASPLLNAIVTYGAKSLTFQVANVLSYSYFHRLEHPTKKEMRKQCWDLVVNNLKNSVWVGLAQLSIHFGLLELASPPQYLSVLLSYTLPGTAGAFFRHKKNYDNGILCISNGEKKKAPTLESMVSTQGYKN